MTRSILEQAIDDLESVITILSVIAFEELDADAMRAVARGAFEIAGCLQHDLEDALPSAPEVTSKPN